MPSWTVSIWASGMLHLLARGDDQRRAFIETIGPIWDGNEVWLVTFGGALFAAFPEAYATIFSGFLLRVHAGPAGPDRSGRGAGVSQQDRIGRLAQDLGRRVLCGQHAGHVVVRGWRGKRDDRRALERTRDLYRRLFRPAQPVFPAGRTAGPDHVPDARVDLPAPEDHGRAAGADRPLAGTHVCDVRGRLRAGQRCDFVGHPASHGVFSNLSRRVAGGGAERAGRREHSLCLAPRLVRPRLLCLVPDRVRVRPVVGTGVVSEPGHLQSGAGEQLDDLQRRVQPEDALDHAHHCPPGNAFRGRLHGDHLLGLPRPRRRGRGRVIIECPAAGRAPS